MTGDGSTKNKNPESDFGVFYLIELLDQNYFALSRVIVLVG